MTKNKLPIVLLTVSLLVFTTACGSDDNTDVIASVMGENVFVTPEVTEDPVYEVDLDATYVECNKLDFTEDTEATIQGTLYVGNDVNTLEVIDVNWEITNITIGEAEDGIQTIIIEQESHGYFWVDDTGNIFATNLNMPVGRLCDCFTGIMIPINRVEDESETKTDAEIDSFDITESKIEWRDKTYTISATESVTWEDADWATGWIEAPSGEGEILPSTLMVRTEVTVTDGYEGLALVLVPITDANGSVYGKRILDAWTEGSYLFNVSELSSRFENVGEKDKNVTEMEVEEEPVVAPASTATPAEKPVTATPKPTETPQPVHAHNYNGVVTTQPTCTVVGVKTFTCSCGASYTESIGTTAHDYSIPVTQTVHHDEQWDSVARTVNVKKIHCPCGEYFTSQADFDAHGVAKIEAEGIYSPCVNGRYMVLEVPETIYDYVKISDAYDEEVIVGYKCSVCGATK